MKAKIILYVVLLIFVSLGMVTLWDRNMPAFAETTIQPPALINTCLITNDVKNLTKFYEQILQRKGVASGEDYVEFPTGVGTLAIFDAKKQENYIPGAAQPKQNRSSILEFRVTDVDKEYARLQNIVTTWVKPPSTQPWGTRSIYFRDPDGNLVDFFMRVKPQ